MKTLFVFSMALFFVLPVAAQENSNITMHRIQAAERDGWAKGFILPNGI
jgi:hypothetical protein